MTSETVADIVSSRIRCNEAARFQGKDPIFSPVLENERLVIELSSFHCHSEDDFRKLVEKLYKFIIESSGDGKRLPSDPWVDSMRLSISELRHHFIHAREHGEHRKVQLKYRKVSEIYHSLIGERVPSKKDWEKLGDALLKLTKEGLVRAVEVIRLGERFSMHEDNNIVIIGTKPAISRTAEKRGILSALATIPVFIPHFTWVPPPQIGGTRACVYATSRPPCDSEIEEFGKFAQEVEQKWKLASYLLSTYGSLNWTISEDHKYTYGCGANNLIAELRKHSRAAIGGIMQGCYGEHYDRTCFLVLYAYRKGNRVLDIGVDFYLSCIPASWSGFEDIYKSFDHFSRLEGSQVRIEHFTMEPLRYWSWASKTKKRMKLEILGGINREVFDLSRKERETGTYEGVIVTGNSLSSTKYVIQESWNIPETPIDGPFHRRMRLLQDDQEFPADELACPIGELDEIVVSITNTVPDCEEVDSRKIIDVNPPNISALLFNGFGADILGINVQCSGPRIRGELKQGSRLMDSLGLTSSKRIID
jgi:hypothetical protein